MPGIKASVMMSIVIVQMVNMRSLVQSYLNTGLKQWHSMKHGSQGSAAASGAGTGEAIKRKLTVTNGLFVKVSKLGIHSLSHGAHAKLICLEHHMPISEHRDKCVEQ